MKLNPFDAIFGMTVFWGRANKPSWIYFEPDWFNLLRWRGGWAYFGETVPKGRWQKAGIRLARDQTNSNKESIDKLITPAFEWANKHQIKTRYGNFKKFDTILFRSKKDALMFKMKFC